MDKKTSLIRKYFYPSSSSIGFAFATVYGFSCIILSPLAYSWIFLLLGVLLLRLNLLAILIGAITPFVFPKLQQLHNEVEGKQFYLLLASVHLALFILSWLFYYKREKQQQTREQSAVFFDPTGVRWALWKRSILALLAFMLLISSVLVVNLLRFPVPEQRIQQTLAVPFVFNAGQREAGLYTTDATKELFAFIDPDDPEGLQSFKDQLHSIHAVLPEWFSFSEGGRLEEHVDEALLELSKKHHVQVLPVLSDFPDAWKDPHLIAQLEIPHARAQLALNILVQVSRKQVNGITIDFKNLPEEPKIQQSFTQLIKELHLLFQPFHLKIALTVYPDRKPEEIKKLEPYVHRFITVTDGTSPYTLDQLKIPSEKLIIRLENYGIEKGNTISFTDVMNLAAKHQSPILWGEKGHPTLHYTEGDITTRIALYDAATAYNQIHDTLPLIPKGYALYRLGTEDPGIWNVLQHLFQQDELNMTRISPPQHVHMEGEGEILRLFTQAQEGKRDLQIDSRGRIIDERYLQLPYPFQIQRLGNPTEKVVALTFSDGPHPVFTKDILDILKKYEIPATFFVIGKNASMHQSLIHRMLKEGHLIGNATFSNSLIHDPERLKLEVHANQRLIEGITGYSTRLFHLPPSLRLEAKEQPVPEWMVAIHELGYSLVNATIDPRDTELPHPTPEDIVQRIIQNSLNGHVITLHDGGEQRENTIKALPVIIETLQSQGYRFITMNELMDSTPQQVMPVVEVEREWINERLAFLAAPVLHQFFTIIFYASIILGIIRLITLCLLAYRQRRRREPIPNPNSSLVSVVLAAYNEEKIIRTTLESIQRSTHHPLEIIVVNDGSTDGTRKVVLEMCEQDPRIRLIDQENKGKSHAINRAFQEAQGSICVSIDADTQMLPQAIEWLLHPFANPKVAAVSGNVKVGNRKNWLTTWQHMEYVANFNLDRRAFSLIKSVPVVPGALGAWLKDAVQKVGFFPHDTLAEDTDVTLKLLREGYDIHYEERALALTEAPEELQSFMKQRLRWVYGTLQCVWKHKDTMFRKRHGKLGCIVIPYMWLFQFLFQLFVPFADLYTLFALFSGNANHVIYFYLSFLLIDLLACWFAFRLEKENPKPLWGFFFQRFLYRYLLSFIVYRSFLRALSGKEQTWNKLQRKGTVQISDDALRK
ncbi:glycosyltransferase [Ammoniphilus sp. CFH 90114]|uniref:glycosyltransferase n=1 Tax=Ammoniphilus sp. CFH 90114 TaxID=2493665 RepID=UPI00100F1120|nr:glycosyltransferase [Ammoniphilus sp. CFH 90114]RXT04345.1 glycosyltransferase [Ammoniphilus sp. CFH 90114]